MGRPVKIRAAHFYPEIRANKRMIRIGCSGLGIDQLTNKMLLISNRERLFFKIPHFRYFCKKLYYR